MSAIQALARAPRIVLIRPGQHSTSSGVARYFDVDAFATQVIGTPGTERSNQLYGPSTRHLDASLCKNIGLGAERTLQFRTEVFNVTNTSSFALLRRFSEAPTSDDSLN